MNAHITNQQLYMKITYLSLSLSDSTCRTYHTYMYMTVRSNFMIAIKSVTVLLAIQVCFHSLSGVINVHCIGACIIDELDVICSLCIGLLIIWSGITRVFQ